MSGGEADGARLLRLARQELLEQILPEVSGEARYRVRLVANAMKIAIEELESGGEPPAEVLEGLAALAGDGGAAPPEQLRSALRAGEMDGNRQFYGLLSRLSAWRQENLG
jgi:Domain of unknown function (DUF6285)